MLNDPLAAQMGLLFMHAEDMFEALRQAGQKDRLDPPLDPGLAAAYDLRGYIVDQASVACIIGRATA